VQRTLGGVEVGADTVILDCNGKSKIESEYIRVNPELFYSVEQLKDYIRWSSDLSSRPFSAGA
jgi:hypothetical protein